MSEHNATPDPEDIERARMSAADVSWSLRAVNRAAGNLDHALAAKVGLRSLDYEAMGHIMDSETSPLGPAELGARLGISTGSATELADRLEKAGHVTRSRDDLDRRRVHLVPQAHAVARILGELGPLFAALDTLAEQFTEQENAVISRYLRSAAAELDAHAEALSVGHRPN
ncbi:MarR family winged helix-turn-helix transcriptional regulator [Cryobacterium arcticum]|uniref:MarR family transcriptional regulator n=1 Tax=Cryobacterium arcticum TaxID=670052 RepID=A0A317ZY48_9MICO|nr:MarR family winged helix-turn-helix transcriptional regulator [Cryobacterium arcticum]PXA72333.1 MarR family transcriptional regulator [Cryobacterium arcticum]